MIKRCILAAAVLFSANAIASQDAGTLGGIAATPLTQTEMAQVTGKNVAAKPAAAGNPVGAIGPRPSPVPPAPSPCKAGACVGTDSNPAGAIGPRPSPVPPAPSPCKAGACVGKP